MAVSLDTALTGLKASQRALDTIANNIANASTVGFTRKTLPTTAQIIDGEGAGVALGNIRRTVDRILMRDLVTQIGISSAKATTLSYLSKIADFHGSSDSNKSLGASLSNLAESFTRLSSTPSDTLALSKTVADARAVANKFNDFSQLLISLRLQVESEIESAVTEINAALDNIATLNEKINLLVSGDESTAVYEDERDKAVRTIAKYLEVSSFPSEKGKITVMTKQGQVLADGDARQLLFNKKNLLPSSYYGDGNVSGLYLDSLSGTDIADDGLGGALGALFELRDTIIPRYQAELDETAQKLAHRCDTQGLRLFTDASGNVPANVADPGTVGYVGFASLIKVNKNIIDDPTLLRSGTYGGAANAGSNDIIRKVSLFAFGAYEYQEAEGNVDISAGTLFASTGLDTINRVAGNTNIASYAPTLVTNTAITAGSQFIIALSSGLPQTITIGASDTATDLVTNINTALGSTVASINNLGQLMFTTDANIALSDVSLGAGGIAALGHSFTTYTAQNPSFTVQVGTQAPVTISIAPGDTSTDILNDLNAITGLSASLNGNGELVIRPTQGGDITLENTIGAPIEALGLSISNVTHTAFRDTNLGPDGSVTTGLVSNSTLEDYTRNMIATQSEDANTVRVDESTERAYTDLLDKRNSDTSGVNIDEELSEMIRIQTNYSASAKMLSTIQKILDELMAAFGV